MSLQYWTAGLLLPLTLALTAIQLPLASTVGALKGPSAVAPSSLDVPFQQKRPSSRSRAGVGQAAAGVKLTTLHTFIGTDDDKKDGSQPFAGLALDASGNLFGTTFEGGRFYKKTNLGTVFQLSPSRPLTILRSFNDEQGANPTGKVAIDSNQQLFGTTYQGGKHGKGTLFKLSARPSGSLSLLTILHQFQGTDGTFPFAGVTIGNDGALYGTTVSGGASQFGTVFKFAKGKLSRLRSFSLSGEAGGRPYGGVVLDAAGNLYGTNYVGGAKNKGTVFQLTPSGGLKAVAPFTGTNGAYPFAGVTLDGAGNVYGTTCNGGARNKGTVFKWVPGGKLTVLHSFSGTDGNCPYGGVTLNNGVLYGTTYKGGRNDNGTVFKIAAKGGPLTVLYRFGGDRDGGNPRGDVILNAAGTTLYGTTQFGGRTDGKFYDLGTVYQLTLP